MTLTPKGEKVKQELILLGLPEDEIEVLFKSEQEMMQYYAAQLSARDVATPEDDGEDEEPVDSYHLSEEQERSVKDAETRRTQEATREKFDAKQAESTEQSAIDTDHESTKPKAAPVEKVDFDDFMKSLTDGYSVDDKDVPNN
jgi:hypothetical protein